MAKKEIKCPAVKYVEKEKLKKKESKLTEENLKKYREMTKGLH